MTGARLALAAVVTSAVSLTAQSPPGFRSGIDAVYLDVTVLDGDNALVAGLTKDDFEIYDEGVQHEVAVFSDAPAPISVGVLIDASRSMTGDRMDAARAAATALGRALEPQDLWSVYAFNFYVRRIIGWRPYDPSVERELANVTPELGTQLFKSVAELTGEMDGTPHRKRALLVITDGADDVVQAQMRRPFGSGGGAPMIVDYSGRAETALRKGEVLLYGIGLDWPPPRGVQSEFHAPSLRRLAEPTGGAVAIVQTVAGAALAAERLAAELRLQYTLGFYPQKAPDGKYRRIKVVTRNPNHRVRTRAGYLAVTPPQRK